MIVGRKGIISMTASRPPVFLCPRLIGRQRDLTTLQTLIEQKRSGAGQTILISGEAGIGKSRLVAEAKTNAAQHGFLILEGQCFQRDCAFPYSPLLDLFRTYFVRFAPGGLPAHLHTFVSTLSRLLPDLALLFPDLAASPVPPAGDHEEEKRRLFAVMTHFLTEQAAYQPILLVVEDIHWADDLSLDFLLHLARRCRQLPLLLLLTYRSEALPSGVRQWFTQLDHERLIQEIALGPLTPGEVDDMVRAILGPEQTVAADLLDTLAILSEGNPFFVEELLKSLVAAGELQSVDGKWAYRSDTPAGSGSFIPRSVQVVVQQRVHQLSAAAKQALMLAATVGRRFDFPVLQEALHCDEAALLSLMKELLAAQLVVEESADRFAFRHALIREAIYNELLIRERHVLHRLLAETLEQMSTTPILRERYLGDLAEHCSEAGMWEQAFVYEHQIGERALALHAPRAAIGYLTRALDAAQHLSVSPSGALYYSRGQAYETLGAFDHAQSDYTHALDLAHTAADGSLEWQALMALGLLWAERDYAQAGVWFRQARNLAEGLADPILQARSLNRFGNWLVNTGHLEEGLRAHQAALKMFESQGHTQGMAETLDLLGPAYGMLGERVQAVEQIGQAIALFRSLGDTQSLMSSLAMRAVQSMPGASETTFSPLRTRDECVQDAEESLRLARQIESLAGQAFAENALAHSLLSFGEFGPALAHAEEAQRIATEIAHQQWLVATSSALGRIYVLLLAPAPALTALQAGAALAQKLGSTFWRATLAAFQARAYLLNHDLAAAQAALQAIMPREQRPRTMAERDVALAWGELLLAQGAPYQALQIVEHLLASAPGQVQGQPPQPIPHLLKLQGEALLALARMEEAVAALEEARRGAIQRNARPVLWTIHRTLGQAYQLLQRVNDARQERAAARQLIEELATTIPDPSLRDQFLRAALGSLPTEKPLSPRQAARHAFGGLTAREHEVAAFIAQGKTSREIAGLLVLSERTVEGHVNNILGKLGFTSRAQIAAWVVERGLANH